MKRTASPDNITSTALKAARQRIQELESFLSRHKQIETEVSFSWNVYRTIFENTGTATVIIEEDLTISLVNSKFEKLSGYSCSELEYKKKLTDFILSKSDIDKVKAYHNLRMNKPEAAPSDYELQFIDRTSTVRDAFVTVALIPETKKCVVSILDITERKEDERKLKLAQERYQKIFDNSAVGITVTNEEERIISWNKFAENLLGMNRSDLYLKPVQTLYPAHEWKRIRSYNVRRKGMQPHLETKIIRKDGQIIDVDISISVLRDKSDKITGAIGIIRDITERKQSELAIKENRIALKIVNKSLVAKEKALKETLKRMKETNNELVKAQDMLIQSEKMVLIGQLSVGIAHEIKNPLAIILQAIEATDRLLLKSGDSTGRKYTQIIRKSAERANRVIVELLNFSRTSHLELKPVNLHEIIDRAIELAHNTTKIDNISIIREYSPKIEALNLDAVLLEELFLNLFTNAIEAMSHSITVKTSLVSSLQKQKSNKVAIEVSDDGIGIPKENIEHMFQPFFTTKEKGKGTGLGLAMALLIAKRHDGDIKVDSPGRHQTRFTVTLPLDLKDSSQEE